MPDSPFFAYEVHSRAFLARAKSHLAAFVENSDAEEFFAAALHLRFGIEARVSEYLKVALKNRGENLEDVSDYVASKLLKRLTRADPTSAHPGGVRMIDEQNGNEASMAYTPVSRELASIHGRLGGFLHHQFFVQNQHWNIRKRLNGAHLSLANLQEVIEEGIRGLEYATSGTMLGNARFNEIVDETLSDSDLDAG